MSTVRRAHGCGNPVRSDEVWCAGGARISEGGNGKSRGSVIFVAMLLGPLGCQAGEGVPHPPAHDPPAKASAPLPSVVAKPAASLEAVPEQRTCTLIFCEDAVTLSFAPHLEAGRYVLVTADTKVRHCAIELTELGQWRPIPKCPWLELSGTVRSGAGVWYRGAPKTLSVELSRDGRRVAHELLTPTYEVDYPNGPECGPRCLSAHATIRVTGS